MNGREQKIYLIRKILLFVIHGAALAAFAIGVVMIYSNENFKKGFTRMNNEVYEDSLVFVEQFENDIVYITDYIATRDTFETRGVLDLDKHILEVEDGPLENGEYTIQEVITRARRLGYYFDENYQLQKSPDAEDNPDISDQVIVDWDNYDPNHVYSGPDDAYMTWDDFVKDMLGKLSRYTIAYDRLYSDPVNVVFYAMSDDDIYANRNLEDQVQSAVDISSVSRAMPAAMHASVGGNAGISAQTHTGETQTAAKTEAEAEVEAKAEAEADIDAEAVAEKETETADAVGAETDAFGDYNSEGVAAGPGYDEAAEQDTQQAGSESNADLEYAPAAPATPSDAASDSSSASPRISNSSGSSSRAGSTVSRDTPIGVTDTNQGISSRDDKLSQNEEYENYEEHFNAASDIVKSLGRYAIIESDYLLTDTNLARVPENIAYLSAKVLAEGSRHYFLAIGIDTSYPAQDAYYQNNRAYSYERNSYFVGLVATMAGAVVMFVTLAFLISMSGKATEDAKTATLIALDRRSPEDRIISCLIAIIIALVFCDNIGSKLLHMYLGEKYWPLAELMLKDVCVYSCTTFTGFSLIRSAKAGILWDTSRIKLALDTINRIMRRESFSRRALHRALLYMLTNVLLISATIIMIFNETTLIHRIIILGLIAVTIGWNFFCFYSMTKKSSETDLIGEAIKRIAGGDIGYQLDLTEFEGKELDLATDINNISSGLDASVNEQTKAERMKANLITNVSHDIKTPLTSIINYVDLIKRRNPQDEKIVEYLGILEQKSHYLKSLTEDLIEASKVSSGNVTLHMTTIDLTELVCQANGEFEERYAERGLKIVDTIPDEPVLIWADGEALWRVLENIYTNAYKYALENSRVYVDIERLPDVSLNVAGAAGVHPTAAGADQEKSGLQTHDNSSSTSYPSDGDDADMQDGTQGIVRFTLKNVSASQLNISAQELTERFVRGDASRTSEGHGLGLSIARSLTQLQGGRFDISIDGDLFKAVICFTLKAMPSGQTD